jgi:molybdenum cofactor cytidylyltransferase/nicotine blue oxidoreductase
VTLLHNRAWAAVAKAPPLPLVVAPFQGRRGHLVRLSSEVRSLLPLTGDEGARRLISSRPDLGWEVQCPGNPADVDTSEDLTRWE